jgi:hypothetical protein
VVPRRAPGPSQAQSVVRQISLKADFVLSLFPIFQLNIARPMRRRPNSLHILRVRCLLACMLLRNLPLLRTPFQSQIRTIPNCVPAFSSRCHFWSERN